MVEFYHGRRLRYEIQVQMDGRWQIAQIIDDERDRLGRPFDRLDLERLEVSVVADAEKAFAKPGVTGVRVVRERLAPDGDAWRSEEILNRLQPPPTQEASFVVQPYSGDIPICNTFAAVFERPAVAAMGGMLRGILDRWAVTPYELMTLETGSARFEQVAPSIYAAIGLIARQQADLFGGDARQRSHFLHQVLDELRRRARASGAVPALSLDGGVDALLHVVRREVAADDRVFAIWRTLSLYLRATRGYAGRLQGLLALNAYEQSVEAVDLLDAAVASLFDAPDFLRDLVGPQRSLLAASMALADLAEGGGIQGSALPDLVDGLRDPIRQGRWTCASGAIWTRCLRALSRPAPLQHEGTMAEWQAVKTLRMAWLPRVPPDQQLAAQAMLSDRENRLRQEHVGG